MFVGESFGSRIPFGIKVAIFVRISTWNLNSTFFLGSLSASTANET